MGTLTRERATALAWSEVESQAVRIAESTATRLAQYTPVGMDRDDLVQEALEAISTDLGTFTPGTGSFEAWAKTVARNRIYDLFRRASARSRHLQESSLEAAHNAGWDVPNGTTTETSGTDEVGLLHGLGDPKVAAAIIRTWQSLSGVARRYVRCLCLRPSARSCEYVTLPAPTTAYRDGEGFVSEGATHERIEVDRRSASYTRRLIEGRVDFSTIRQTVETAWMRASLEAGFGKLPLPHLVVVPDRTPSRRHPRFAEVVSIALDGASTTATAAAFAPRQHKRVITWPGVTHPAA